MNDFFRRVAYRTSEAVGSPWAFLAALLLVLGWANAKAVHLKLDELLRGSSGARTSLVKLEEMSDEELDRPRDEFERLRRRVRRLEGKVGEGAG